MYDVVCIAKLLVHERRIVPELDMHKYCIFPGSRPNVTNIEFEPVLQTFESSFQSAGDGRTELSFQLGQRSVSVALTGSVGNNDMRAKAFESRAHLEGVVMHVHYTPGETGIVRHLDTPRGEVTFTFPNASEEFHPGTVPEGYILHTGFDELISYRESLLDYLRQSKEKGTEISLDFFNVPLGPSFPAEALPLADLLLLDHNAHKKLAPSLRPEQTVLVFDKQQAYLAGYDQSPFPVEDYLRFYSGFLEGYGYELPAAEAIKFGVNADAA